FPVHSPGPFTMITLSRRAFVGSSLAASISGRLWAATSGSSDEKKITDDSPFQPSTLFLTWHRDPTTTMTIQWVGTAGETADTTIYYAANALPAHAIKEKARAKAETKQADKSDGGQKQQTVVKPYPLSEFKLYRAELTGLKPGTDYEFRIGNASPTYRFRTMP